MAQSAELTKTRQAVALLRMILGVIILATWWENLTREPTSLYNAEGLTGFFNWLFDPIDGNGSTLTTYRAILEATILQVPGLFAAFQMVAELLMGIGLLVGGLTRLAGLGATVFFFNLFLSYYGGHEWIWTYVLLTASALVVTLACAGREWGADKFLLQQRGEPPLNLLW